MKKAKAILLMAMCLLLFSGCMSGGNRTPSENYLPDITEFMEFHAAELRGGQPLPYIIRYQSIGFIIDEQKRLWSFGDNSKGLLGLGFKDEVGIKIVIDEKSGHFVVGIRKYPPTPIMDNVVDILANTFYADHMVMALKEDGTVWAWGELLSLEPIEIAHNIVSVYWRKHFYLLDADGTLFEYEGKVDTKTYSLEYHLVKVMDDVKTMQNMPHAHRFLFLKKDNSLWASGPDLRRNPPEQEMIYDEPVKIMDNVKHFHQDEDHVLAVTWDDRLYGWGSNSKGQLGNDRIGEFIPYPHLIAENVDKAYAFQESSFFITLNKTLMAMGGNDYFALGNDGFSSTADPVVVLTDVIAVFPKNPFLALTSSGTLFRWGIDSGTDMGSISTPQMFATDVLSFCPTAWNYYSAYHIVKTDRSFWGWGLDPWITKQTHQERTLAGVQPWTQLELTPPSGDE